MDGVARLWSRAGELKHTLAGHSESIFSLRFDADARQLLTGSYVVAVLFPPTHHHDYYYYSRNTTTTTTTKITTTTCLALANDTNRTNRTDPPSLRTMRARTCARASQVRPDGRGVGRRERRDGPQV